jgi:malonate-semialdehyde dehydrogenase (acetylating)/methylmalonate-semialdehyde dehydrogenase
MQTLSLLRTSIPTVRTMATSAKGLNTFARSKAEEISKNWKGTSATGGRTKYLKAYSKLFSY